MNTSTKQILWITGVILLLILVYSLPMQFGCNECKDVKLITIPKSKNSSIKVEQLYKEGERQVIENPWFGRISNSHYLIGNAITNKKVGLFKENLDIIETTNVSVFFHNSYQIDRTEIQRLFKKLLNDYEELSNQLWIGTQLNIKLENCFEHSLKYEEISDLNSLQLLDKIKIFGKTSEYNFIFLNDYESIDSKAKATTSEDVGVTILRQGDKIKNVTSELITHEMTHMKSMIHNHGREDDLCNVVKSHSSCCKLTSYLEDISQMTTGMPLQGMFDDYDGLLTEHSCQCTDAHEHETAFCRIHISDDGLREVRDEVFIKELEFILENRLAKNFKEAMKSLLDKEYSSFYPSGSEYWSKMEYIEHRLSNIKKIREANFKRAVTLRMKDLELIYKTYYLERSNYLKTIVNNLFKKDEEGKPIIDKDYEMKEISGKIRFQRKQN